MTQLINIEISLNRWARRSSRPFASFLKKKHYKQRAGRTERKRERDRERERQVREEREEREIKEIERERKKEESEKGHQSNS